MTEYFLAITAGAGGAAISLVIANARRARGNLPQEAQALTKQAYVYLLTNRNNTVLYTGVTNDVMRRVFEHKEKLVKGFTE
jgi:hypothetical protein